MKVDDSVLFAGEAQAFSLRQLYASRGYKACRMNKFEEYDIIADVRANGDNALLKYL